MKSAKISLGDWKNIYIELTISTAAQLADLCPGPPRGVLLPPRGYLLHTIAVKLPGLALLCYFKVNFQENSKAD